MSDEENVVLERVAAGDPVAVKECMDRFGGLVWTLARRALPTAQDAEDATQEIFTEIWLSADRYDQNRGSETVFVATIARRRLIDRLRKQGIQVEEEPKLNVYDEDGTELGELIPDLFVEGCLMVELKARRAIVPDDEAQLLGYLRASHIENGLLINFGAPRLYIRKYILTAL